MITVHVNPHIFFDGQITMFPGKKNMAFGSSHWLAGDCCDSPSSSGRTSGAFRRARAVCADAPRLGSTRWGRWRRWRVRGEVQTSKKMEKRETYWNIIKFLDIYLDVTRFTFRVFCWWSVSWFGALRFVSRGEEASTRWALGQDPSAPRWQSCRLEFWGSWFLPKIFGIDMFWSIPLYDVD